MQVGDLVVRTYGEGQRPTAIIVDVSENVNRVYPLVSLIWAGHNRIIQFGSEHLEVISASR